MSLLGIQETSYRKAKTWNDDFLLKQRQWYNSGSKVLEFGLLRITQSGRDLEIEWDQKDHPLNEWKLWNIQHVLYDPEGRFSPCSCKPLQGLCSGRRSFLTSRLVVKKCPTLVVTRRHCHLPAAQWPIWNDIEVSKQTIMGRCFWPTVTLCTVTQTQTQWSGPPRVWLEEDRWCRVETSIWKSAMPTFLWDSPVWKNLLYFSLWETF